MRRTIRAIALIAMVAMAATPPVAAYPVKGLARVGQCATTRIKWVGTRLVDGRDDAPVAGSGSAVTLANGVYGVSYDQLPAIDTSRRGDPVRVCLTRIPRHCPKGDDRGRFYKATNLRTHRSWTLLDAEHMCGGA